MPLKTKSASVYFSKQTRLLFCAAPHISITIVCSSRILTSDDILSVVLDNQLKSILCTLVIFKYNH